MTDVKSTASADSNVNATAAALAAATAVATGKEGQLAETKSVESDGSDVIVGEESCMMRWTSAITRMYNKYSGEFYVMPFGLTLICTVVALVTAFIVDSRVGVPRVCGETIHDFLTMSMVLCWAYVFINGTVFGFPSLSSQGIVLYLFSNFVHFACVVVLCSYIIANYETGPGCTSRREWAAFLLNMIHWGVYAVYQLTATFYVLISGRQAIRFGCCGGKPPVASDGNASQRVSVAIPISQAPSQPSMQQQQQQQQQQQSEQQQLEQQAPPQEKAPPALNLHLDPEDEEQE